jgi:branched-chain amino acid transport system permease protein
VLNPPFITTEPGTNFPLAMFNAARIGLIAIGLNVVVGQAGLLDLGYVGFFAVGAYVAALFTSPDSSLSMRYPWLAVVPLAMVITMVSGLVLGTPTLRLRGDYLAIVTLGFGELVRLLADNIPALRGNSGFQQVGHPPGTHANGSPIFILTDGKPWYWLIVTVIIVVLLLVGNLERSRVGRAWVAIREDEDVAEMMGVPTFKFKLWSFAMGASIGGMCGVLFASKQIAITPANFQFLLSVLIVAAVVLGGSGNLPGVIVGAFIVAWLPERFRNLQNYRVLIFGASLVVIMIFRPEGLIPSRKRRAEMAEGEGGMGKLGAAEVVTEPLERTP